MFWAGVDELPHLQLASRFAEFLPLFFEGKYAEGLCLWNKDCTQQMRWFAVSEEKRMK